MRKIGKVESRKDQSWGGEVLCKLCLMTSKLLVYHLPRGSGKKWETPRKSAEITIQWAKLRGTLIK